MKESTTPSIPLGMFFRVELKLQRVNKAKKWPSLFYQFPDLKPLLSTSEHPSFAIGFDDHGLKFSISSDCRSKPKMSLDKWRSGDSLELFIDSKSLHNARTKHRFFHQFVIFPESIEEVSSRLFRFEAEKRDNVVQVHVESDIDEIRYDVTIPWEVLEGFDYGETAYLGFGFRLNRTGFPALMFPVASNLIDKMPSLLARCEVS